MEGWPLEVEVHGPTQYFSSKRGNEFVSFLNRCSLIVYVHTKKQTVALVSKSSWLQRVECESSWWIVEIINDEAWALILHTTEPLAYAFTVCSHSEILNHYYDLLQQTLLEHTYLADKPNHTNTVWCKILAGKTLANLA